MKVYYIWAPKYIGGELNGPDLLAGVTFTRDERLRFNGRSPELMLQSLSVKEAMDLEGEAALALFHAIVEQPVPASLQLVYSNASKEESGDYISSLPIDA